MRRDLTPYPDCERTSAGGVQVEVLRPGPDVLTANYVLRGAASELVLPPLAAPVRTDGLWRHTCCEAFLRSADSEGYLEFNFSPSTAWAAYVFDGYRQGMRPLEGFQAPEIETAWTDGGFTLQARLSLPDLTEGSWRLGLSAVLEEAGGRVSYWALAHPPGKPDFHHPDCFALDLPAIDAP